MINKKAQLGDQIPFVAFLFLLVVIGAGIVFGVFMFFGGESNFRGGEASILANYVGECLTEKDISVLGDIQNSEEKLSKFYDLCGLDSDVLLMIGGVRVCENPSSFSNCVTEPSPFISSFGTGIAQACEGEGFLNSQYSCGFASVQKINLNGTVTLYGIVALSKQNIGGNT